MFNSHGGGLGGGTVDGQAPTIPGATGGAPFMLIHRSGRGAGTLFGGGAPGRSSPGVGYNAGGVPGAGGGGGIPERVAGQDYNHNGGRGANGVVIVRY